MKKPGDRIDRYRIKQFLAPPRWLGEEHIPCDVTLEINVSSVMRQMAWKALKSKRKLSRAMGGAVVLKAIPKAWPYPGQPTK